jgi:alpha-N-arabinofuranosidase
MGNIAQMVNVLQALILTDGAKMVLTPTYHIFDMYKVHHDATLLPVELKCGRYEMRNQSVPELNISSSKTSDGKIHITIVNVNPNKSTPLNCEIRGQIISAASGSILTALALNSFNSFENANTVIPKTFNDVKVKDNNLSLIVPAKSVIVLEVKNQ